MRLAREFGQPSWRAMLSGMSCTELQEWVEYYGDRWFSDELLDAHFSQLKYLVVSAFCETEYTPGDFSLINPTEDKTEEEPSGEKLMLIAEGISGGVRYGPEPAGR
ncbi:phage tail assembly protein T [Lelliottia sp. V89_10]|uniref:phage tail assembly protein T n=1 Tax=Lelliottia wanjuensis TaxID=3050585 RepID=UPI00249F13D3|nr:MULTISPECIES: phage tail assembly protein T [unclassified Lelliottia]MDI3359778.1 phage tail assembly protein T [Lelliottia sp. V89_13]MDK9548736.1 phage tail assembly protein T [Lelliottia sp. V89_5]MDK9597368.1 phage tail assembly protein T [Lelliottia sp. V89_10]